MAADGVTTSTPSSIQPLHATMKKESESTITEAGDNDISTIGEALVLATDDSNLSTDEVTGSKLSSTLPLHATMEMESETAIKEDGDNDLSTTGETRAL